MRKTRHRLMLFLPLSLIGCGPGSTYARMQDCQTKVGPEPYALGHAFGLIGGLIMISQPEHQQWQAQMDACMARSKLTPA